ncbi:hypothetical protein LGT41_0001350 [Abyssibius alkaniclasticus]|uniref:hypothetical protein n=1 Tax=Abyssibius alkaniclasticus TaxID=2881234 RepID=UPI0023641395|nr:hypothetical protein [Abyssibius alkaniclasticus]UPH71490.1 hypothetical protein LGT41_0001350 [Abyssibius alkaniclasticus]
MRICFVSNSHAGAIKRAIDADRTIARGHRIAFFASAAGNSAKYTFIDNVISTPDPDSIRYATGGAFTQIAPGDFDALVFYGIQLGFGRWIFPGKGADHSLANCSSAFRGELINERLSDSLAMQFAFQVCSSDAWNAQVIVAPTPVQAPPETPRSAPFSIEVLNTAATRLCAGFGATFVPQPPETLDEAGFTRAHFAQNSLRFRPDAAPHPEDERNHMNAAFGALMLRDILAALR